MIYEVSARHDGGKDQARIVESWRVSQLQPETSRRVLLVRTVLKGMLQGLWIWLNLKININKYVSTSVNIT